MNRIVEKNILKKKWAQMIYAFYKEFNVYDCEWLTKNWYVSMYISTWIRGKLLNTVMLHQILIEEWLWFCSS